ncbi:hypothetical protein TanjilG_03215 [Lupinus angustifolius]|uniref:Protein kinase domain-containing protein n=1 Tax=Lupinus angustifolius TaxID=3871 RepID=A0A4P1RD90_LUPAN|nr:hypothetical protein TanjilG_03215 [Lupinus angustifolius]
MKLGCFPKASFIFGSQKETFHGSIIQFSFEELENATESFSASNLIGLGGSSYVYRGRLEDELKGRLVQRLLVFQYIINGNLRGCLDGVSGQNLDWSTRVAIAIGAARGLEYLHEAAAPKILHRDVKSSNIILDGNWQAKGTFGYFAPEYAIVGRASLESDVFSFGWFFLSLSVVVIPSINLRAKKKALLYWSGTKSGIDLCRYFQKYRSEATSDATDKVHRVEWTEKLNGEICDGETSDIPSGDILAEAFRFKCAEVGAYGAPEMQQGILLLVQDMISLLILLGLKKALPNQQTVEYPSFILFIVGYGVIGFLAVSHPPLFSCRLITHPVTAEALLDHPPQVSGYPNQEPDPLRYPTDTDKHMLASQTGLS